MLDDDGGAFRRFIKDPPGRGMTVNSGDQIQQSIEQIKNRSDYMQGMYFMPLMLAKPNTINYHGLMNVMNVYE
jgi:hypothetical protein